MNSEQWLPITEPSILLKFQLRPTEIELLLRRLSWPLSSEPWPCFSLLIYWSYLLKSRKILIICNLWNWKMSLVVWYSSVVSIQSSKEKYKGLSNRLGILPISAKHIGLYVNHLRTVEMFQLTFMFKWWAWDCFEWAKISNQFFS